MRPTDPRPGRRAVLLGGIGAVIVSGCTLNNPYSSEKTPAAKAVRDLAPDVGVAVQALALITAARTELDALRRLHPRLATSLSGLDAGYEAYSEALRGAVPHGVDATSGPTSSPTTPAVPSSTAPPTDAMAKVRARDTARTLQVQLNAFALQAESGAFARLLGSMAAGLAQQLEVLAR